MDTMVVLAYDLAAVLIVLLTIAFSSQRGFATGFVRLFGQLAAFFGAMFLAKNGAGLIYDSFFKTEVIAFLNTHLQGGQAGDILAQIQGGISSLPSIAGNILELSIDIDKITMAINSGAARLADALESMAIRPAVTGFLSVILFTIIFILLGLLVRMLTCAVKFVFKSPILQPIDRFFGGIMGLLQAALNLYLICVGFKLFFYFAGEMPYCSQSIIMNTVILSKIYAFDPMALLASLI